MEVRRLFECTSCYHKHNEREAAVNCCPREVNEVFECPWCGKEYQTFDGAKSCLDWHWMEQMEKAEKHEDD